MTSSSSPPLKENKASSSNPPSNENLKTKRKSWVPYDIGIMIIDEDPTSLLFVHTLLKTCHYRVMSYEDPAKALADLFKRSNEIDLVIADLHLITMSGLSLVHKVAKQFKLPVITTCVDKDPGLLRQALACGSCFHLVKPITISSMEFVWKKSWRRKSKNPPVDHHRRLLYNLVPHPNPPTIHHGGELANARGKEIVQVGESSSVTVNPKEKGKAKVSKKKKQKSRLEWANDLHTRFLVAVSLLGEDSVPTSILGIMNVHGLSVKQVASHLQKHRGRVNDEKEAEENLKSVSSRRSSTVGRFPTSLIPAGSKRPIKALEENLKLRRTKKAPLILPKTSFQYSEIPGSSTQNPWSLATPELPAILPNKQRKKPRQKRAPKKTPTARPSSSSFGIPILNSFYGEIVMFDPSVLNNPFQYVGESSEGNAGPPIRHNQVVKLDSSEGNAHPKIIEEPVLFSNADPVIMPNPRVDEPMLFGNADPMLFGNADPEIMHNQVEGTVLLFGNADPVGYTDPDIMHNQVEETVLFGNIANPSIMRSQVEEHIPLAKEQWPGLLDEFLSFDEGGRSSNELLAGLECHLNYNYNYKDLAFDDEMLNEMFEKIDKEG